MFVALVSFWHFSSIFVDIIECLSSAVNANLGLPGLFQDLRQSISHLRSNFVVIWHSEYFSFQRISTAYFLNINLIVSCHFKTKLYKNKLKLLNLNKYSQINVLAGIAKIKLVNV